MHSILKATVFIIIYSILTVYNINEQAPLAQQFKLGKNLKNLKPSALLELEDSNQALLLTRVFNPNKSIASPYKGMILYDSSLNKLAYYDGSVWQYPLTTKMIDTSIYNYDGTLKGNRIVAMGGYTLGFTGGKVGIGTSSPIELLDMTSSGDDNYIRVQAGGTFANNSGILLTEYGNTYGWRIRHDAGNDNLSIEAVNGNTVSYTPLYLSRTTQKVGINTTSPAQSLDVNGTIQSNNLMLTSLATGSSSDNILVIDGSNNVKKYTGGSNIYNANGSLTGNRIVTMGGYNLGFIGGKMGIGTSNPLYLLSLYQTDATKPIIALNDVPLALFNQSAGSMAFGNGLQKENLGSWNTAMGYACLEALTDGASNTGIGTGALHSNTTGNNNIAVGANCLSQNTTGSNNIAIGKEAGLSTESSSIIQNNNIFIGHQTYTFGSSLNNTLNIGNTIYGKNIYNSNPNIGIATSTPAATLDVNGTTIFRGNTTASYISMNATSSEGNISNLNGLYGYNDLHLSGDNGSNSHIYINNGGNVGIGTTSPSYKLDINGTTMFRGDLSTNAAYSLWLGGTFYFRNNNVQIDNTLFLSKFQGISDARLKKDIIQIPHALSIILQLNGVTYNWRKDMEKEAGYVFKKGKDYGVIAQDIQKVIPELVEKDSKGFLTVDYIHLTPILIEAIKEQQQLLNENEQKINKLTQELEELKVVVKQIQSKQLCK